MITKAISLARNSNPGKYLPDVNKNYVWGGVLITAIAIGLYYWGKKNSTINPADVPNDTVKDSNGNIVKNPFTEAEKADIIRIANALNSEFGWGSVFSSYGSAVAPFIGGGSDALLTEFSTTSDKVFVSVYNYYNTNYVTPPGTMKSLIETKRNWSLWYSNTNRMLDAIIARMDRLGLK